MYASANLILVCSGKSSRRRVGVYVAVWALGEASLVMCWLLPAAVDRDCGLMMDYVID